MSIPMKKYRKAFQRHEPERFAAFLTDVEDKRILPNGYKAEDETVRTILQNPWKKP